MRCGPPIRSMTGKLSFIGFLQWAISTRQRLACDLLADIGTQNFSVHTAVDAVLAALRISVSDVPRSDALVTRDISARLFSDLDTNHVGRLLDQIASSAPPLMDGADFSAASEMADLVRRLVSRFLDVRTECRTGPGVGVDWMAGRNGRIQRLQQEATGKSAPREPSASCGTSGTCAADTMRRKTPGWPPGASMTPILASFLPTKTSRPCCMP